MSEWTLQYQYFDGAWVDCGEMESVTDSGKYRWRHNDGTTQPARTDDEGRLLGPVTDIFSETSDPEFDAMVDTSGDLPDGISPEEREWLSKCKTPTPNIDRDGNALRSEIDQQAQAIAERSGGLHEIVGKWPGDEPDHHTRAQLVDGLRGEWRESEPRIWRMTFAGYAAEIEVADDSAHGCIYVDEVRASVLPWSQVSTDGEGCIMRCAALLSEKVDAVREMVERLRDG